MEHQTLIVPAFSTNAIWCAQGGQIVKTREAKAYTRLVRLRARESKMQMIAGDISLHLVVFNRGRMDLSNVLKLLEDSLQGIAYVNDSGVTSILMLDAPDDSGSRRVHIVVRGERFATAEEMEKKLVTPKRRRLPKGFGKLRQAKVKLKPATYKLHAEELCDDPTCRMHWRLRR